MIGPRLVLAGFGRRGVEALVAVLVLTAATAMLAATSAVVEGARAALHRAERAERPDIIRVTSRFNRALFELPTSGMLPPATLPVYEPLIDPDDLKRAAENATVVRRQSLLRNVPMGDHVSNVYIFGIDPGTEQRVSMFHLVVGRFLRTGDRNLAVLDEASAHNLSVGLGDSFPVRTAGDTDLGLKVVGILDGLDLRGAPLSTIPAPELHPGASVVTGGVFVTLETSEDIFARPTLTDALVVAHSPGDVPSLVRQLGEQFRLQPEVFVEENYTRFQRQVHDFEVTLALFGTVGGLTAVFAGILIAALLHDAYEDRRRQYAILAALGFPPLRVAAIIAGLGLAIAAIGGLAGAVLARVFSPAYVQMPSLLANLGPIRPRFDATVAVVSACATFGAVLAGMARTVWIVGHGTIARALREDAP